MYKILLCWRYLKTRYLAIACIISVMLGVATLIVVNSVMSGFSHKLQDRLHGLLSDIVVESMGIEGFENPQGKMELIRKDPFLGPRIEAMTATMEVPAMFQVEGYFTKPVKMIGIEPEGRSAIGGFKNFLVRQEKADKVTFDMPPEALKAWTRWHQHLLDEHRRKAIKVGGLPPPAPPPGHDEGEVDVPCGIIVGNLMASHRKERQKANGEREFYDDYFLKVEEGHSVVVTTIGAQKMSPVCRRFVVVDYFKSEMSEYDSQIVFVPLAYLQHLRTAQDTVTSIQIKLKDYRDAKEIKERLAGLMGRFGLRVATWEDKQGPLLAAISIEKGILNILLFLIVGVAGFGILAIFSMIVAEKTRDIGILKALGASSGGIMKIFLSYGLLLGLIGASLGSLLGLSITNNINEVEAFITWLTGQELFDRSIYYFSEIPTHVQTSMLLMVNLGAIGIAVVFSVLPALRAAWLHPVRALRFE